MTTITIRDGDPGTKVLSVTLPPDRVATIVTPDATITMLQDKFGHIAGDFPFTYVSNPNDLKGLSEEQLVRIKNVEGNRDDIFRLD